MLNIVLWLFKVKRRKTIVYIQFCPAPQSHNVTLQISESIQVKFYYMPLF